MTKHLGSAYTSGAEVDRSPDADGQQLAGDARRLAHHSTAGAKIASMQSNPLPEAQRYRDTAQQIRLTAERASSPTIRRQLLDIAEAYDVLAQTAERLLR